MVTSTNSDGAEAAPSGGARAPAGAGASDPPLVIRGESTWTHIDPASGERSFIIPKGRRGHVQLIPLPHLEAHPYAAITDWLNFTFPAAPFRDNLGGLFSRLFEVLGPKFAPAVNRRRGLYVYDHSFDLGESGAKFAWGGNNDTALVSLSGEACSLLDWPNVVPFGQDELQGRITRWDGAIDDYQGLQSVDSALQVYRDGLFGAGGRKPKMKQHGNWADPDGSGRSLVIGKRENGKRLQVYEKGMELGIPWHPWTRWELSLGSTGRVIPWDVLTEPGRYVVGAYPKALSWAQKEASRIFTIQKQMQLGYEALVDHASRQYGPFIGVMLEVEGSAEKVVAKLKRKGTPKRLKHPLIDRPEEWLE